MIEMRRGGYTYSEIAFIVGQPKERVVNWFLRTTGKTIGIHKGYHSKDEVHKRCGVYFDVTSLAEDLKGERVATD
jgi:alkylated DNA nucleotide flippase Atl1